MSNEPEKLLRQKLLFYSLFAFICCCYARFFNFVKFMPDHGRRHAAVVWGVAYFQYWMFLIPALGALCWMKFDRLKSSSICPLIPDLLLVLSLLWILVVIGAWEIDKVPVIGGNIPFGNK